MIREILSAIRITLVLWVLTAILYPAGFVLLGQLVSYQSNGSLIAKEGKIIGSELIGQPFTGDQYFWSRPSTITYSSFSPQDYRPNDPANLSQRTGLSGASNAAPSSQELRDRIRQQFVAQQLPSADLLYTSGSGLDPHISPESAKLQVQRIAAARSIAPDQITNLIAQNTEGRFLGIFGEPRVHVLKLNLAIDDL